MKITVATIRNTIEQLKVKHGFVMNGKETYSFNKVRNEIQRTVSRRFPGIRDYSLVMKIAEEILATGTTRPLDEVVFNGCVEQFYAINL